MELWLDIHLSPAIGDWIARNFSVATRMMRDLGYRVAEDGAVFKEAQRKGVVIVTKDSDFAALVERLGPPPQVLLLRCGNTSNQRLKEIFSASLVHALELLESGEALVEIGSAT